MPFRTEVANTLVEPRTELVQSPVTCRGGCQIVGSRACPDRPLQRPSPSGDTVYRNGPRAETWPLSTCQDRFTTRMRQAPPLKVPAIPHSDPHNDRDFTGSFPWGPITIGRLGDNGRRL